MHTRTSVAREALKTFTRFAFHAFSKDSVHSLISSGYNWPKLASDVLTILITHYASCGCGTLVVDGMLDLHLAHLLLLIESASQCPNQESNLNLCAEHFSEQLLKIECFLGFSRDLADTDKPERYHYNQHVVSVLSRISNYLVKMKVFSVKVFQILSSKIYDLTIAHNFDDPRSQGPITSRSLLNPYTRASLQVVVHTFAMNTLIQFQFEIPEKFAELCSLLITNRNSLCEKLAIFPLRLFYQR